MRAVAAWPPMSRTAAWIGVSDMDRKIAPLVRSLNSPARCSDERSSVASLVMGSERRKLTKEELEAAAEFKRLVDAMSDSQHTLGAKIGVTQGMVWQWADGQVPISAAKARAAAKAVGGDPFKISVAFREVVGSPAELLGIAGTATEQASQSVQLDPDTVRAAHELVRGSYEDAGNTYDIEAEPDVFAIAYQKLVRIRGQQTLAKVASIGRDIDRLRAERGGDDAGERHGRIGGAAAHQGKKRAAK